MVEQANLVCIGSDSKFKQIACILINLKRPAKNGIQMKMLKNKPHYIKFLSFVCGLLLLSNSFSQTLSERKALIIGISNYNFNPLPKPLTGVPYDIDSATRIALSMGIQKENITYLKDAQATKANVLRTLKEFSEKTSKGTRAFVYFSGHGTRNLDPNTNQCYEGLLTYEGNYITSQEFTEASRKLATSADKVIAMVDACHAQGVVRPVETNRSLFNNPKVTAKFYSKNGQSINACAPVNAAPSRGMLEDFSRLGGLKENFVQITSSRADEVSWDEEGRGGMATQAVRDCLLGKAKDLDNSGAVTMMEVQRCAQTIMNEKMKPQESNGYKSSHITITGNRNIIPVVNVTQPPIVVAQAPVSPSKPITIQDEPIRIQTAPAVISTNKPDKMELSAERPNTLSEPPLNNKPPSSPIISNNSTNQPEKIEQPSNIQQNTNGEAISLQDKPPEIAMQPEIVEPMPEVQTTQSTAVMSSVATLENIYSQRNPNNSIKVSLRSTKLRIGQDQLNLTIESERDGYVYLVMVGSDAESFYILFPNGRDDQNQIRSGKPMKLPRFGGGMSANGPVGIDHLLIMVADSPRRLDKLSLTPPDKNNPYTYSLNNLAGRSELINFLVGSGVNGSSESFGAQLVRLEEVK